jgi:hypothetical protein
MPFCALKGLIGFCVLAVRDLGIPAGSPAEGLFDRTRKIRIRRGISLLMNRYTMGVLERNSWDAARSMRNVDPGKTAATEDCSGAGTQQNCRPEAYRRDTRPPAGLDHYRRVWYTNKEKACGMATRFGAAEVLLPFFDCTVAPDTSGPVFRLLIRLMRLR